MMLIIIITTLLIILILILTILLLIIIHVSLINLHGYIIFFTFFDQSSFYVLLYLHEERLDVLLIMNH